MWPRKKLIIATVLAAVVAASALVMSCSSTGDEGAVVSDTPQNHGQPEGIPSDYGLSEDLLARIAEILGIDQQTLEDAFAQAQSEMAASMPEDGQLPEDMPSDGMPSEGTPPEDMPSDGMPPEGTPPEDMPSDGMSPGFGLPDDLLARVAEILGIDQQTLEDAFAQAQSEMAGEIAPPNSD